MAAKRHKRKEAVESERRQGAGDREQGTGDRGLAEAGSERSDDCKLKTANSRGNVVFLEFQNQSAMPVVYRLGDAFVLPSGYGETWGLAVNEAQACGRPSLVSDCVGCARDIIREGENGMIFRTDDWEDCVRVMREMADAWSEETKETNETKRPKDEETKSLRGEKTKRPKDEESSVASRREVIRAGAWGFDTARGAGALLAGLAAASKGTGNSGQETCGFTAVTGG